MKIKTLYTLIILLNLKLFSQIPNWQWAKSLGGDYSYSTTTDTYGNTYVLGNFSADSITFGTITLYNDSSYYFDLFIVKYDGIGNVIWAKSAGGNSSEYGNSISVDANGNVYVTGSFQSSSIIFGVDTLNNAYANWDDIFIAKYDSGGNVLWAKSAGGYDEDLTYSLATDASGNTYVTGSFRSPTITFGTTILNNTNSIYCEAFIVKYDASGNVLWAKSAAGNYDDYGYDITTDASGNVYVIGNFESSTITFGTATLNSPNTFITEIFIVKLDASGNVLWAKSAGGNSSEYGNGISVDVNGNVYVTGSFQGSSITFGATTLNNTSSYFSADLFIVKYDFSGNVVWARSVGGNGNDNDEGHDITTDASGNVYVIGSFESPTITFGTTTLNNTSSNKYDLFISKFDGSGNVIWAKSAGGSDNDYSTGIATDTNGNLYVVGNFESSSISFGTTTIANAGAIDIFVGKLNGITGINESISENIAQIYPNPSTGKFAIQIKDKENSTATLYNYCGVKIGAVALTEQETTLNISELPAGMYFVEVVGNDFKEVKKIIKQ